MANSENRPQLKLVSYNPDAEPAYTGDPECLAQTAEVFNGWLYDNVPKAVRGRIDAGMKDDLMFSKFPVVVLCTKLACQASCKVNTEARARRLNFKDPYNGLEICADRLPEADEPA